MTCVEIEDEWWDVVGVAAAGRCAEICWNRLKVLITTLERLDEVRFPIFSLAAGNRPNTVEGRICEAQISGLDNADNKHPALETSESRN